MLKGALAVILALFDFAMGGFGFSRPSEMVSVRWHGHTKPTLRLKWDYALGGCKELKLTQHMLLWSR